MDIKEKTQILYSLNLLKRIVPEKEKENVKNLISFTKSDTVGEFEILKAFLNSGEWPQAVNPEVICSVNSKEDKLERAEGILNIVVNADLIGKKFLDFGTGEGHVPFKAQEQKVKLSVGYDLDIPENPGR